MNTNRNTGRWGAIIVWVLSWTLGGQVLGDSFDAAWTLGAVGMSAYRLDGLNPADSGLGQIGAQNPTLTLELGKRYQVSVTDFTVHPLEIIAKGSNSTLDGVLLSMGATNGSLESQPQIQWVDDGKGTIRFTMTSVLYQAMTTSGHNPGYRCRPHAPFMRGDFTVTGLPIAGRIAKGVVRIGLETVASGLAAPVDLKPTPDQTGRLCVVDQAGKIFLIDRGVLQPQLVLDVTDIIVQPLGIIGTHDENDYDERGLLGMAFHPGFADANNPGFQKLYTYTSEPVAGVADFSTQPRLALKSVNHQSVITEWTMDTQDPNRANPDSFREVLRVDQPQFNHNGGMLAFGPDGYLYIAFGDGGNANDTGDGHGTKGNGQNINTVHGSILRVDPLDPLSTLGGLNPLSANGQYRIPLDNPFVGIDGVDEIFAYGFRNPFRFSIDTVTGLLIVADVGQDHVEEIDLVVKGGNYGWNLKEGTFRFNPADGSNSSDLTGLPAGLLDPVAQYDHDDGSSIIGGYLYQGKAVPGLVNRYIFGDFSLGFAQPAGRLFYADLGKGQIQEFTLGDPDRPLGLYLKGFGQDNEGEIYVLASSALGPAGTQGVVLKIVQP